MNKRNLIKYIKGQADTSLTESILDWLEKSSANLEYFIKLKNLYTASNLPNSKALDKDWLNCNYKNIEFTYETDNFFSILYLFMWKLTKLNNVV